jgi:hypothetical protein
MVVLKAMLGIIELASESGVVPDTVSGVPREHTTVDVLGSIPR